MNPVLDWKLKQELKEQLPFEIRCFVQEYINLESTQRRIRRVEIAQYVVRQESRMSLNAACESAAGVYSVGITTARDCYRDFCHVDDWL